MNAFDYSKKYATCAGCGDIHGEFDFLVGKMLRMELTDTLVIVAWDCGIGFDTPGYDRRAYQRIKSLRVYFADTVVVRRIPSPKITDLRCLEIVFRTVPMDFIAGRFFSLRNADDILWRFRCSLYFPSVLR